jgi:hypothetical protein
MSSKGGYRAIERTEEKKGFRKIRKGFLAESSMLKTNKQRYFKIKFNQLVRIAESGILGITKDDLKQMMKDYIESEKKPEA